MNSNRNRYTSAPMYGIKNKKPQPQQPNPQTPPAAPQNVNPPYPPQGQQPYGQMPPQNYNPNPQGNYAQMPPRQNYNQGYPPVPPQTNYNPQTDYQQPQQGGYFQNGQPQSFNQPQQNYPYGQSFQPQAYPQENEAPPVREPRRHLWLIPVMLLVLPVLFILSLVFPNLILRIVFLVLTAAAVIFMWAANQFGKSARYTLTLVHAALAVIVAVSLAVSIPAHDSRQAGARLPSNEELFGGDSGLSSSMGSSLQDFEVNDNPPPAAVVTPEIPVTSPAEIQLNAFMSYWAESQLDLMVDLCLPDWVAGLENPKTELFILLANRTPLSYTVEKISGSDVDSSRTITLTVLIDKKSTTQPAYYQMQVLMLRVNDTWYVDPNSLGGTKLDTTPHPGAVDPGYIGFVPTATPEVTAPPAIPNLLYYNPDGGQYYHADPNCSSVDKSYLPLEAFNYADLNNTKFKNLLPCRDCKAPDRPLITGY